DHSARRVCAGCCCYIPRRRRASAHPKHAQPGVAEHKRRPGRVLEALEAVYVGRSSARRRGCDKDKHIAISRITPPGSGQAELGYLRSGTGRVISRVGHQPNPSALPPRASVLVGRASSLLFSAMSCLSSLCCVVAACRRCCSWPSTRSTRLIRVSTRGTSRAPPPSMAWVSDALCTYPARLKLISSGPSSPTRARRPP